MTKRYVLLSEPLGVDPILGIPWVSERLLTTFDDEDEALAEWKDDDDDDEEPEA